jgi:WD40 repeat protein
MPDDARACREGRRCCAPAGWTTIITHSADGSLRLWDIKSGVQIGGELRDDGDKAEVWTAALSPNGNTIAVGSSDGILRVWDIGTRNVIAKWTGYMDRVGSVCWGADGEHGASGCEDGMVRVWHAKSGEAVLDPIKTGNEHVNAVVYSPDTTMIATGGGNDYASGHNAIQIWSAKTGELLCAIEEGLITCRLTVPHRLTQARHRHLATRPRLGALQSSSATPDRQISSAERCRNVLGRAGDGARRRRRRNRAFSKPRTSWNSRPAWSEQCKAALGYAATLREGTANFARLDRQSTVWTLLRSW